MAPAKVLADGGTIMAGGNGPVKGIRIAGVVIEDASSSGLEGLAEIKGGRSETRRDCVGLYSWRCNRADEKRIERPMMMGGI